MYFLILKEEANGVRYSTKKFIPAATYTMLGNILVVIIHVLFHQEAFVYFLASIQSLFKSFEIHQVHCSAYGAEEYQPSYPLTSHA